MEKVDGVVIGAGVVGLAVARAFINNFSTYGRNWLVLESSDIIGSGSSSRNSEVIHTGIYYSPRSLKAQLCVQGCNLLYSYLTERSIPHKRCGKLIVATEPHQLPMLDAIFQNARINGVNNLEKLTSIEAQCMEPSLKCLAALYSPSTGILDSYSLMQSLQGDFENEGGVVVFNSEVSCAQSTSDGVILKMSDGTTLLSKVVVNSAGVNAPSLAHKFSGLLPMYIPTAYFAKGNYFSLTGHVPFTHLIYPLPETAGLGVHLTLDMAGQAKFGPDVQWVDNSDDFSVSLENQHYFYKEVRKYWPDLKDGALQPGYAGIRPKVSGPDVVGSDFIIQGPETHGVKGLVNLFGIESPGLTSALAIAKFVSSTMEL